MIICSGKSVLNGVAIGKIYLYKKQEYVLEQTQVEDVEAEIARFEAAKEKATQELDALYQKALTEAGLPCRLAPPHLVMQNAMSVALCGEDLARAGKLVSAQELLPVYLRPPQAQRLRQPPQV